MQDSCVRKLDFNFLSEFTPNLIQGIERIDLAEFVGESWVTEEHDNIWLHNYLVNRDKIVRSPCLKGLERKAFVFIGSSPAIKKNCQLLLDCERDAFVVITCNGALPYLDSMGLKPDFVFAVEARDHILSDFNVSDRSFPLVVSPFICPQVYDIWDGNIYTYMMTGGKKFDAEFTKDLNGEEKEAGGGNVINTSIYWALRYLGMRHAILIGVSLCYYDDYYWDGRSTEFVNQPLDNLKQWYRAIDINGNVVATTPALTMYKVWLETLSRHANITFINATEDGILGVYPEPITLDDDGNMTYKTIRLPWVLIKPLSEALAIHAGRYKNGINWNNLRQEMSSF